MSDPTQKWQQELEEECKTRNIAAPVYNTVADQKGGRSVWSATVTVNGQAIASRYWYDGQALNNAREDAAEVACTRLRNPAIIGNSQAGWRGRGGPVGFQR